ncbi:helix-turn-helix transcriptional regulator [Mesorhizobium sp. 1M-11]|uniref:helix-turn-helix domain-containing protein n=1 Tax=Mesorhizobium sp. 1M-11 TaxID=1529006 RepID=UPI0006C75B59|nr:helix-turn-helix transcriptional regulator [Mesorhizobium sp. 1M-11]
MHHTETAAIAARLLGLRQLRNVTQMELASHIGVSYQQLQKYERGRNRISPAMLQRCAAYLSVSIDYFFPEHAPISAVATRVRKGGNPAGHDGEVGGLPDPSDWKMWKEFLALPSNMKDSIRSLVADIHDVHLGRKVAPARPSSRIRSNSAVQ